MVGVYVDDLIFAGGQDMKAIPMQIATSFPSKGMTTLPFLFTGCHIEKKGRVLLMQQLDYARILVRLTAGAGFYAFRRPRHKLTWIALTRPEIRAPVNLLAQVKDKTFAPCHLKAFNKAVSHTLNFVHKALSYPRLNPQSLHRDRFWTPPSQ